MSKNILLSEVEVILNGTELTRDFMVNVLEVTVENSLHLPDVATLVLYDATLNYIDDSRLAPGKTLQLMMVSQASKRLVFDGEIVEIQPDFDQGVQRLTVRAFNRMHRLSRGRHVRSFQNVSDKDLITQLAAEVGLQADVDETAVIYPYVFQNNESNLAFLQKRAAALGYLLYVQKNTLYCKEARSDQPSLPLEWGSTLHEFHPCMTTVEQVDQVMVRGWDPMQKRSLMGQENADSGIGAPALGENDKGAALAQKAFHMQTQILVADRPIRQQGLIDQLAQAEANRQVGRFIEAEGTCYGEPALVAGTSITITKVGKRFSGQYFVTDTVHRYSAGQGYTTSFSVSGYHPSIIFARLLAEQAPALMTGLVIALVTDNDDPQKMGRVKVKYPWLSDEHASDWIRVASPGGGNRRGIEFLPEINDEVLVGFEMGDIHYPYVLGGLWNGKDAIPEVVTQGGQVVKRIIKSRSGHTITLDDSEGKERVLIEDKSGNTIEMNSVSNKLTIQAKGEVGIQAGAAMTLEAQGEVSIRGSFINLN